MSFNLVPYNNAMRLGQGFNTYTQQICIDDAVIINPKRPENILTNYGSTMRILAQSMGRPSAWCRQPEIVPGEQGLCIDTTNDQESRVYSRKLSPQTTKTAKRGSSASENQAQEETLDDDYSEIAAAESPNEPPKRRRDTSASLVDDKVGVASNDDPESKMDKEESMVNGEKENEQTERERRRLNEFRQARDKAASLESFTKDELKAMKLNMTFENSFRGIMENQQEFDFAPSQMEGPSQVVTYCSRFVDKLSDITDDMNISGALSIKGGKFGGSGRGAFVDSDKFKQSDLNFYISVKVVNQTINFKDPLQFDPVRSCTKDNFIDIFGDGFISGFQEGGEFNALVSMKILNKAKRTDIKAGAKVAFTAGPLDVSAEANVNIAKQNIETNTETTIQVSWSGGGQIKPREQQWDIKSLMEAAARFPDLVALRPQRTYAIITKYDTLRSFVKLKPAGYTPLQYENAQIYTNALMDAYMSYKSLHTRLAAFIFGVQNKTKIITPRKSSEASDGSGTTVSASLESGSADGSCFEETLKGLEDARREVRHQMSLIVNEVDKIADDPSLSLDFDRAEPFQCPSAFEQRLPTVEPKHKQVNSDPLGGKRILAKTQTKLEYDKEAEERYKAAEAPNLYSDAVRPSLTDAERKQLDELKNAKRADIGKHLQVTSLVGSPGGNSFNNIDFLLPEWNVVAVRVQVREGALAAIRIKYDNGLVVLRGDQQETSHQVELKDFRPGERIVAGSIQTATRPNSTGAPDEKLVISLQLHTNRGRHMIGQAATCSLIEGAQDHQARDGFVFTGVATDYFDPPMVGGTIKGFWGSNNDAGFWKLGMVWGDIITDCRDANESDPKTMDPFTTASISETDQKQHLSWDDFHLSWKSEKAQIYCVIWGGAFIREEEVGRRMREYAETGRPVSFVNDTFGRDPCEGVVKTGQIIYSFSGSGVTRCLLGREGQEVAFDKFPCH